MFETAMIRDQRIWAGGIWSTRAQVRYARIGPRARILCSAFWNAMAVASKSGSPSGRQISLKH